jgi:putative transposase
VNYWTDRAELPAPQLLGWLGLGTSKFHDWKGRYGKVNEHNGMVPRDWWLEDWEKRAIVDYHDRHPLVAWLDEVRARLREEPRHAANKAGLGGG